MLAFVSASNSFAPARAQQNQQYIVLNETAANIRFVGIEGEMLIFELKLNSLLPKGSMLTISDEESNVIFEERTTADTYSIRYKIARDNFSKINFEISGKAFFLNQSFNVNSRTEEKIEVTKV